MERALLRTAVSLRCSERTLRRYVDEGLLHGQRLQDCRCELSPQEERYAREHRRLLRTLRNALLDEHAVRMAAMYGSCARGDDTEQSDVDLLVAFQRYEPGRLAGVQRRLTDRLGRRVHAVQIADVTRAPDRLSDALSEARVFLDRDRQWPELQAQFLGPDRSA